MVSSYHLNNLTHLKYGNIKYSKYYKNIQDEFGNQILTWLNSFAREI